MALLPAHLRNSRGIEHGTVTFFVQDKRTASRAYDRLIRSGRHWSGASGYVTVISKRIHWVLTARKQEPELYKAVATKRKPNNVAPASCTVRLSCDDPSVGHKLQRYLSALAQGLGDKVATGQGEVGLEITIRTLIQPAPNQQGVTITLM